MPPNGKMRLQKIRLTEHPQHSSRVRSMETSLMILWGERGRDSSPEPLQAPPGPRAMLSILQALGKVNLAEIILQHTYKAFHALADIDSPKESLEMKMPINQPSPGVRSRDSPGVSPSLSYLGSAGVSLPLYYVGMSEGWA